MNVELLDISVNGVLTSIPTEPVVEKHMPTQIEIELSENTVISMDVELAHQEECALGFHCLKLDMDSASHLRRLIELNIGTENASERVLDELISRQ